MIDFRSDTLTQPTPAMLQAMFQAKTGDDVFEEDPTVRALEKRVAEMFGKDKALFCPSGTMTNQIGIKCHTSHGDEVICEKMSHVYVYEGGGIAFNSGCQVRPIEGLQGEIQAEQIIEHINPVDVHRPTTRLVSLENTSNRGGGTCYEMNELVKISRLCREKKIGLHLDGARLWNALVKTGESPKTYGTLFDSISVCLSKGLGAPVGSLLLGSEEFIYQARRIRKILGGGMRQAGYLAAAGLYAIENHIDRLQVDHEHAQILKETLEKCSFVQQIFPVETNILIFELNDQLSTANFLAKLREHNILALAVSPKHIRMITHLDISAEMIEQTIKVLETIN